MLASALTLGHLCVAGACAGSGPPVIDRSRYEDRLRAMWLGQAIANWTGRQTEGQRKTAPFFTDADWGGPLDFVTNQNPWGSDDDTDIEYVYLHLLTQHATTTLTNLQISAGWIAHLNQYIWVSNAVARDLMDRGVSPPSTALNPPNHFARMIDAQLTTEFFGALAPGMPARALEMADLPIRTTASSFSAHAAQFHVVLYSLAPLVDPSLPPREQLLWLTDQARRFLPDSSKTADIVDFVRADFVANPDIDDWERTRDAVYDRYQLNATLNGFTYLAWYESSVNFAAGLIALLYGDLDYQRTVQIGTLSGWDSDNGTATMGALLGLLLGSEAIEDAFPLVTLSDRYDIHRTRPTMPDLLPGDAQAQDTFTMMAQRMIPIIDAAVGEAGGRVDASGDRWLVPAPGAAVPLSTVSTERLAARSANVSVRRAGGIVSAATSHLGVTPCCGRGSPDPARFSLGQSADYSGADTPVSTFFTSFGSGQQPGAAITLTVEYDREVELASYRLVEAEHWHDPGNDGGWFESVAFEARIDGVWTPTPVVASEGLDSQEPWQWIEFALAAPVDATGIRLIGAVGGADAFVTVSEFDGVGPAAPEDPDGYDVDADGSVTTEDLYAWHASPVDVNGDGTSQSTDRDWLTSRVRWAEPADIRTP